MAPPNKKSKRNKDNSDYYMFGLHAVKAAIENPNRIKHELWISQNARAKIFSTIEKPTIPIFNLDKSKNLPISENKVHQGAILKVSPLKQPTEIDELGKTRLKESYMKEDEESPQERFKFVCDFFASNEEHAERLYNYASRHWLSFSTPILSFKNEKRQLPISCYLSYLDDSSEGLVDCLAEVNWLSMMGGGVGIHVGIREADNKSVGVMPHLKVYDASTLAYRQGKTRRGSYATFLDISHPDIIQFLEMRKPTGDQNFRTLNPVSYTHLTLPTKRIV